MIFGIGFHKTGTSSLASALRYLGFRTIHGDGRNSWPGADEGVSLIKMIERGDYNLPTFKLFDAFLDNPYAAIWRNLDEMFPSAKFILTLRDADSWIESCVRYYGGRRVRPMRLWIFGENANPTASAIAKQAWLDTYQRHNASILHYFGAESDRFITMNVVESDGWEKLCPFLGVKIPSTSFPRSNARLPPS
jgi:hypothetical protein